jgi:calcineurin-like phosphoesterase family protein
MQRFATSDEHFYHNNILTGWDGVQKPRPFATMEEMVEGIIDRHNAVVKDNDEVFHLGDMFWKSTGLSKAIWIRQRLRGKHFYALGNHDELFWTDKGQTIPSQLQNHFESVKQRYWMPSNGINRHGVVLEHYAGHVWQGSHKGSYQFYGHSHGKLNNTAYASDHLSYDVGVDVNDFTPVAFEDVAVKLRARAEQRGFKITDAMPKIRYYSSITD